MVTERGPFIAAIDQGTTSTRCLILDAHTEVHGSAQTEHRQRFPRPGWVEHDPVEIWQNTVATINAALVDAGLQPTDIAGCGIANQRETAVVWDRSTGDPVHPAIVWQDTRTEALCAELASDEEDVKRYRAVTGLPPSTYFTGPKISWILDHVDGARSHAERGELLAGTMDSWLIWHLTGGPDQGHHITDVTNASRTLLMDLSSLSWRDDLAHEMGVPVGMLPSIRSSSEIYGRGHRNGPLPGVPVAAALGDQHAALVGQGCLQPGSVKATYGTGAFVLANTGPVPVQSANGLLTTVAYQFGQEPPAYALEGSIAMAGSLIQWLRDRLELIHDVSEVEALAADVNDSGGAYLVPAFSGLYAPRWRPDARGVITGLTSYTTKRHLVRAALEAACYQTREVVEAICADTTNRIAELKADGGMANNSLLMQLLADTVQTPDIAPAVTETTALGAGFAAGLAVGLWSEPSDIARSWRPDRTWNRTPGSPMHTTNWRDWNRAVDRSLNWVETTEPGQETA